MTSPIADKSPSTELPPLIRSQLDEPTAPVGRRWTATIAPAFLIVATWFPLLDLLGAVGRPGAENRHRALISAGALLVILSLLYVPLAWSGLNSRRRLAVTASSSLGVQGAEWITGVLVGLFSAVWCATAISYSARLILAGLVEWRFVEAAALIPTSWNGVPLESPLVLTALGYWTFIILAANGLGLMGAIAAMMRVYAPVVLILLMIAAVWSWLIVPIPESQPSLKSPPLPLGILHLLFGAFAFACLLGVEWGATARNGRDVRLGGWVGIFGFGLLAIVSTLSIAATGSDGTLETALVERLGGTVDRRITGSMLLLFGLASLAPACFGAALFTKRFRYRFAPLKRWKGVWLSALLFWLPAAVCLPRRPDVIFAISGALFLPATAVLAAEAMLRRQRWAGMRLGWNRAGVVAWGVGAAIGVAMILDAASKGLSLQTFQPNILAAWLASCLLYFVLAIWTPSAATIEEPTREVEATP